MMGQHSRSESLFYYFRIEDQVPENHLLRLLDRHISFDFVREKLKDSYSDTGRPSIDPELLLRILLIGYLYGVTSERKLVEELQMHLAWRWFTGLSFDQEIPHHSTFSKNRHGRFLESNLFQQLFEEIVDRCQEAGLVEGEHLSVDGSFIAANASRSSRIPPGAVSGSRAGETHHPRVFNRTRATEPDRRADPSTSPGLDDRSRFHVCHQGISGGGAGVLQQLSDRQPELRHSWRSGYGSSAEPGKCGGSRDDHTVSGETRALSTVGCCRHDLWER